MCTRLACRDIERSGGFARKQAAREFVTPRSPGARLLFRAEMRDHEQALQVENRALEAHVAGCGHKSTGLAKLQSGQRTMLLKSFPNQASVFADTALAVETVVVAKSNRRIAHREEIGQLAARDKRSLAAKIFRIKSAPLARQFILPTPNPLEVPVEMNALAEIAAGNGIVERWQGNIRHGKQHAIAGRIDVFHCLRRRLDTGRPTRFPGG